jgi:hypothetical protein
MEEELSESIKKLLKEIEKPKCDVYGKACAKCSGCAKNDPGEESEDFDDGLA